MKKNITLMFGLLLSFCLSSFAQVNFQSDYFKNFLLTKSSDLNIGSHSPEVIDIDNDGTISEIEASLITKINIYANNPTADIYNISEDLTKLINLEEFIIKRPSNGPIGSLSSLNLSQNTKLKKLSITDMSLTTLDVSNNLVLEDLILTFNNLTNIDISKNKQLTRLIVRYNRTPLSNIDFSNNLKLERLTLDDAQITAIDVTNNGLLNSLIIDNNPITELNILNNCNLSHLTCLNTLVQTIDARNCKLGSVRLGNTEQEGKPLISSTLKKVYLTGQPFTLDWFDGYDFEFFQCGNLDFICIDQAFVELTTRQMNNDTSLNHNGYSGNNPNCTITTNCDIPVVAGNCSTCPIINFPDPNFKQALLNHSSVIDTDGDGEICIEEAEKVIRIYQTLENKNITDITGIEYFTNLEGISLENNSIATADFSNNLKLRTIHIDNNKLTSINILNNTELTSLSANNNLLNTIDVSKNKKLFSLSVYYNKLKQLDVSNLPLLFVVYAWDNEITSFKTANSSSLGDVLVQNNLITNLDLSTNTNLYRLYVDNNKLAEIDVRNCKIRSLNLSNNISLKKAYLTGNHEIYESFNHFILLPGFGGGIQINNCPSLEFVCVNNVSFFNDIKNWITNQYPNCIVSTNCDNTVPVADFNTYFRLSPNPTTGVMWLTRSNPKIGAIAADIYNAQTGTFIKTVDLLFSDGLLLDPFKPTKTLSPGEEFFTEPTIDGSAYIDCYDVQKGTYILKVYSNRGTFSTTFIKSTEAIR